MRCNRLILAALAAATSLAAQAAPTIFTVTKTAAGGNGSFTGVLADQFASCPAESIIQFAIPAATDPGCDAATGICVVQIPDNNFGPRCSNTVIDGYTQPGASPNTKTDLTNDAKITIEFNNDSVDVTKVFQFRGADHPFGSHAIFNVSVRGIAFPRHQLAMRPSNSGSVVGGGGGHVIAGNRFGWHADGTRATGIVSRGILMYGDYQSGFTIGGPNPADRNLLTYRDVAVCCEYFSNPIDGPGIRDSIVQGNYINVAPDGSRVNTNGVGTGIVISGNWSSGIPMSEDVVVQDNVVFNAFSHGMSVGDGPGMTVSRNIVTGHPVHLPAWTSGRPNPQAPPVLDSETQSAGGVSVAGSVTSQPDRTVRIEFFHNSAPYQAGGGRTERFVKDIDVTVNSSGNATFSVALPADTRNVAASVTDLTTGETSLLNLVPPQVVIPVVTRALTVAKSGNGSGTVTSSPAGIDCGATCDATFNDGTVVTLTATPTGGHAFASWGGACTGTSGAVCSVTMDQARSASASFSAPLDPSADDDGDGITNGVETAQGTNPGVKDNDVFGNPRLFTMQQYRDFLGREGDAGGIDFWTGQVNSGAARAAVIESFFGSPEFQGTMAPVARLYFAYFLRIPDYPGLNFWIGSFRAGNSLESISNFFAGSAEFQDRYGALDNAAFVNLVYQNVLGRAPDAGGFAFWKGQLDNGIRTRGQVMLGFSESEEYRGSSDSNVYVTMVYFGMLRRAPDAGGFAFWVNHRNQGNSGLALIDGFLASQEYRGRFLP